MVRTVEVPKRLVKSNRKSATPAPAGPTPQQLELERLTTENARLSHAQAEACEKLAAVQEDLLAAQKREASLSDLMSSAGCDTVALGPLSWSIDSAQQLLCDEEAARAALQVSCLPTIHAPPTRSCACRSLLHRCTHTSACAGAAAANQLWARPHPRARRSTNAAAAAAAATPGGGVELRRRRCRARANHE